MAYRKESTYFHSLFMMKVVILVLQFYLLQYRIGNEADWATKKFWAENEDFFSHAISSLKAWQTKKNGQDIDTSTLQA